ncbi:hypothetical protein cyc_05668 [Cyclospora cayetanensis]|uniref:Transmembrane protein n=1 Tax=Cyclospora cayetanensis TaxID=88456 RepID=A0A1D3D3E6_9EIME|nr:hypothetical protein cyc_05668 [Cyclospora cayetanensis]
MDGTENSVGGGAEIAPAEPLRGGLPSHSSSKTIEGGRPAQPTLSMEESSAGRFGRSALETLPSRGGKGLQTNKERFHMLPSWGSRAWNSSRGISTSIRESTLTRGKNWLFSLFCFTGRLGMKVDPFTLRFLDKDIEKDWMEMRAQDAARCYWWLGAIILVQLIFDLIDRTVGGVPLDTRDGQMVLLPIWLTIPLPVLLFALCFIRWGRRHSNTCLTVIFFLYSPLFLLYSTRPWVHLGNLLLHSGATTEIREGGEEGEEGKKGREARRGDIPCAVSILRIRCPP